MDAILVTGSRGWCDHTTINNVLSNYDTETTLLIVGDAAGADTIALDYWKSLNGQYIQFKPDWKKYGKKAGPLRNIDMINYALSDKVVSVTVLAFNLGTPGTRHTIQEAKSRGLTVVEYTKMI